MIPAVINSNIPNSKIANTYDVNVPGSYNMDNTILDGKVVREEPLKVGSKVPIMAGASESNKRWVDFT